MRISESPPRHRAGAVAAGATPSDADLAHGRRLVVIIVLTVCVALLVMLLLWSGSASAPSGAVSPIVGEATAAVPDEVRLR